MEKRWVEFKPKVSREVLILLAGMVWLSVGIMLLSRAYGWWQQYSGSLFVFFVLISLILGSVKGYYIMTRVVRKNILRIHQLSTRNFVLAFITLRTYLLILVMMILGIVVRHAPVPKIYLAIVYLAVGIAMLVSSPPYFIALFSGKLKLTDTNGAESTRRE